jgi:tRNA (cmo5U34)-methyltransferase
LSEVGDSVADDQWINFDSDYGRDYAQLIRTVIPGYGWMHELAAAAARANCPTAQTILIVGPALGEELDLWLLAYPRAQFTLVDPSAAMVHQCRLRIDALQLGRQVNVIQGHLEDVDLSDQSFDIIVAQLVLHLLLPHQQLQVVGCMAKLLADRGLLLFSGSGCHPAPELDPTLLQVWRERLVLLGVELSMIERFSAARNRQVFLLDLEALGSCLCDLGCSAPVQLFQAAHVGLCSSIKGF